MAWLEIKRHKNGFKRGSSMDVKGITIHNTGKEYTAKENLSVMQQAQELGVNVSVHFFVDKDVILLATPLDQNTWHTGKGNDMGNLYTISIEICSLGTEDEYKQAESNACFLIRQLMGGFDLQWGDIYFHNEFDNTRRCPNRILDNYVGDFDPKYKWLEDNGLIEYSEYLQEVKKQKARTRKRS